ncbi:hypothetical protein LIER_15568 [Lithospermum erythrorhizon]|uniref:Uncharacterized protein n=1 Tax=Lithospermum erythrorhizon TaxID=34254 RepID=A0AAV3Q4Y2_LITER
MVERLDLLGSPVSRKLAVDIILKSLMRLDPYERRKATSIKIIKLSRTVRASTIVIPSMTIARSRPGSEAATGDRTLLRGRLESCRTGPRHLLTSRRDKTDLKRQTLYLKGNGF